MQQIDAPRTDAKGRHAISEMTDREVMEEILTTMRSVTDALDSFVTTSPMARMIPGLNKLGR